MNTQERTLSCRYAKAFLNIYENQMTFDDLYALERAERFFLERKEINFFMKISSLNMQVKKEALVKLCSQFGLQDVFLKLLFLLVEKKRLSFLPELFKQLRLELKRRKSITEWLVKSSIFLNEMQKETIENFLKKTVGMHTICTYKQDETLIAGVRVQSDTLLWEVSLRQRLQRITRFLVQ